jgi:flagellar basal body-associated protein FliL
LLINNGFKHDFRFRQSEQIAIIVSIIIIIIVIVIVICVFGETATEQQQTKQHT